MARELNAPEMRVWECYLFLMHLLWPSRTQRQSTDGFLRHGKSGNEPSMIHWWTFYKINVIYQWKSMGPQRGRKLISLRKKVALLRNLLVVDWKRPSQAEFLRSSKFFIKLPWRSISPMTQALARLEFWCVHLIVQKSSWKDYPFGTKMV